ncbi:winged helix-turn-helix transcriptional regulator [Agrobacterium rhizogenes]|uniref:ArsR/SmtB family transcription factor n=1 Tax=Rhizobium rhizogenes TaxID=359 RepID=UPI0015731613|nr:metalloregulator ArsR/SmtB family transcription factor [Rhizobium rhizogenes]NTH16437.1 winged helix-turn-helix transcriptional regulator [Rhizobium rhizogenes]NTI78236.1 winged helix-turn-helix transcriptional regulator [Rhizobium rhizogenes]
MTSQREAIFRLRAELFSMLANPYRLMILDLLMVEEMAVGRLAKSIALSESATSQHLRRLRDHNIVKTRREGHMIYYSFNSDDVRKILSVFADTFQNPSE